jgi:hypothetical protein
MKTISLSVGLRRAGGRSLRQRSKTIGLEISAKKFSNLDYRRIRFLVSRDRGFSQSGFSGAGLSTNQVFRSRAFGQSGF